MMSAAATSVLLAMSAPPYWHCGRTIRQTSFYMLAGLAPAVIMAVWNWGLPAARVMALCVATAVLTEALCQKAMGRELSVDDFTAVNSGLLLAFLLPAAAPWWLVMLGAFIAMTLGKMAFGGLGANPVNTPLVGWAVLFVSFPLFMDPNAMQLATDYMDPLIRLKYFGVAAADAIPFTDLLLGGQINGLGAGQVGALFLGGSFLAARGIIRWQISLGFFLGVAGLAALYCMLDPTLNASPFFHLCTGSVMLGGFFLATESANAPARPLPMFIYGLLGGALTIVIRKYGVYVDGTPFAILLVNLLTPFLDLIRPKPFGAR
ncbi:MAG: RnfABCDGE type electron transport complex subunit D [Desulfovibrio sp.]|uniref:RnfABCDGE type electron transport complex subunit D n=1 Tax=Desulfovibrio sp. TaxID=885 RepID=UPI00258E1254|nr:RnfABCDGE type electron transport complex subunit D [Desulfovibrio sp.]MCD7983122.1 RnfABCDGE type electron transport complex subunit D [Desulfovibrio sp.]